MRMKLFEEIQLKFESPDWKSDPILGFIDTILESHIELTKSLASDITSGQSESNFGRGDTPSVEQIVRAAIYKEIKNLDYRELAYDQKDSRICEHFVKINRERPYSFQVLQKYISKISEESLKKLMIAINKIMIEEGLEDISRFRQDSTVVETNIHYPTNNSLVWDCIKESHRLLQHLKEEINVDYNDYRKAAKKTYFKINVNQKADVRFVLFQEQLKRFMECINQVSNIVKKKSELAKTAISMAIFVQLELVLGLMNKVYAMTKRKEIDGEVVPNKEKLFSIYELHTDIIVKGKRDVKFGHKVQIGTGNKLILTCDIPEGNPADSILFKSTIDSVINDYGIVPNSSVTDGGYASLENQNYAKEKEIKNIVFNKIVGSLENIVSNKEIEEDLKKWRSGIEAVISNLKRGFHIARCMWKGLKHFKQKVLWSIIAYNFRVMTCSVLEELYA
jgi:IS5 family transposase